MLAAWGHEDHPGLIAVALGMSSDDQSAYVQSFVDVVYPRHMNRALFVMTFCLVACQTTTHTTNRIAIGMSQAEVIRAVGKPHSKSAEIQDGVSVEKWIYKETTWDQGGWSWNRTVSDSAVVFQNGRVVSFGVEKERHLHQNPMNRGINVNVSHDDE